MQTGARATARRAALVFLLAATALPLAAQKAATKPFEPQVGQAGKDVVWVPTPDEVVEKMLDMAQVGAKDRVVDLGSGDGKIAIAAARRGARAKGIEYDPRMVEVARRNAREAGVKVEFVQGDIFKSDFTDADVVTLYLLPSLNERLRPTLLKMKPGTRITSHQFLMGDWEPDETVSVGPRQAHFWRVPARVEGRWEVRIGNGDGVGETVQLELKQQYQKIGGAAEWAGHRSELHDARLAGGEIGFNVADAGGVVHRFEGMADRRGRISGTVSGESGGQKQPFIARRR